MSTTASSKDVGTAMNNPPATATINSQMSIFDLPPFDFGKAPPAAFSTSTTNLHELPQTAIWYHKLATWPQTADLKQTRHREVFVICRH